MSCLTNATKAKRSAKHTHTHKASTPTTNLKASRLSFTSSPAWQAACIAEGTAAATTIIFTLSPAQAPVSRSPPPTAGQHTVEAQLALWILCLVLHIGACPEHLCHRWGGSSSPGTAAAASADSSVLRKHQLCSGKVWVQVPVAVEQVHKAVIVLLVHGLNVGRLDWLASCVGRHWDGLADNVHQGHLAREGCDAPAATQDKGHCSKAGRGRAAGRGITQIMGGAARQLPTRQLHGRRRVALQAAPF